MQSQKNNVLSFKKMRISTFSGPYEGDVRFEVMLDGVARSVAATLRKALEFHDAAVRRGLSAKVLRFSGEGIWEPYKV